VVERLHQTPVREQPIGYKERLRDIEAEWCAL
jgi:hypothetical protein